MPIRNLDRNNICLRSTDSETISKESTSHHNGRLALSAVQSTILEANVYNFGTWVEIYVVKW